MSLLGRLFGIDARSAAAFRIAVAAILLRDLMVRSSSLVEHYTDAGVLPRSLLIGEYGDSHAWSLHMLSGTAASQAILMSIAAAAAVGLLVGYRTRLMTVISWVMVASIQARNPWVCNAGDALLRVMLFWAMFVPLGAAWSIDAVQRRRDAGGAAIDPATPRPILSFATAALLLQLCAMYWMTAASKMNEVWASGEAMQRVLAFDLYLKGTGQWLRDAPAIAHAMSVATPWLELIAPIVCFVPLFTPWFRLAVIAVLIGFHAGIETTMNTGMFQYAAMACWLLFIPAVFWDAFRPVRWTVGRSASALGGAGERVARLLPAARAMPWWSPHVAAAAQVVVASLAVWVAVNSVAKLRADEVSRDRTPQAFAGLIDPLTDEVKPGSLAVIAMDDGAESEPLDWIGRVTRLSIEWRMFARPVERDGWNVIVGTTTDGRRVSMLEGGAPYDELNVTKPAVPSRLYPDHRWRKYMSNVSQERWDRRRRPLAGVMCRWWNARHPESQVDALEIYFMEERYAKATGAPRGAEPLRRRTLWQGPCPRPSDVTPPSPDAGGL